MKKTPKCKGCGKLGHYQINCTTTRRAPIARTTIKWTPYDKETHVWPDRTVVITGRKQRAPIAAQSSSERAKLIRDADRVHSLYVRQLGMFNGMNRCYTCDIVMPWKELQCGHFINRRKLAVRWHINNCRPQCNDCNVTLGGNLEVYERRLAAELGEDFKEKLWYEINTRGKVTSVDIREIIEKYTKLLTV